MLGLQRWEKVALRTAGQSQHQRSGVLEVEDRRQQLDQKVGLVSAPDAGLPGQQLRASLGRRRNGG